MLKLINVTEENKFHILIKTNSGPKFFRINYKIFDAKLIEFVTDQSGNVTSITDGNQIKFLKGDNLKMVWVAALKNDFAQSVSNTLSFELSRVGLDLSEWLRRFST